MRGFVSNCIFCKIISGAIPAKKIYEDEHFIVIPDAQPQAKKHFLIMPKEHILSLETAFKDESKGKALLGEMFALANKIALQEGLLPKGFRSVLNTNHDGGQTVFHIHLHVLGGEPVHAEFGVR